MMICGIMLALAGCPKNNDDDTANNDAIETELSSEASQEETEQEEADLDISASDSTAAETLVGSVDTDQDDVSGDNEEANEATDEETEEETAEHLPEYNPVDPDSIEENVEGDFVYTIEDTTATITGYVGTSTQVRIPESLGGASVITIGSEAFKENSDITYVYISSTVNEIEGYAFTNRSCTTFNTGHIIK